MVRTRKRNYGTVKPHKAAKSAKMCDPVCSLPYAPTGPDRLTTLPLHLTLKIMEYLSPWDLCAVARMCRGLDKAASDDRLWKRIWEAALAEEPTLDALYKEKEPEKWRFYKTMYGRFAMAETKWMTGEGMKVRSVQLKTPAEDELGNLLAMSSRYILVAIGTKYKYMAVFSAKTGEHERHLLLTGFLDHPLHSVVISPDDKFVAAHCGRHTVCVWNIRTGLCLHSFVRRNSVRCIAMHGNMLAAGFVGGVRVWSLPKGKCLHRLPGFAGNGQNHYRPVEYQMVMDDQHLAVYDGFRNVLQLHDVQTGKQLFTCNETRAFKAILLDIDTKSVVGLSPGAVCIWDTETGTLRGTVNGTNALGNTNMAMQDGRLLVHNTWGSHRLDVIDLMGMPSMLYSIAFGSFAVSGALTVVSNAFALVNDNYDGDVHLVDVKHRRRRLRDVAIRLTRGRKRKRIVGVQATFKKLGVMREGLNYEIYNFAG